MRYPVVANKALCEFSDQMKEFDDYRDQPIDLVRNVGRKSDTVAIYNSDFGMLPNYTGHVQGMYFL